MLLKRLNMTLFIFKNQSTIFKIALSYRLLSKLSTVSHSFFIMRDHLLYSLNRLLYKRLPQSHCLKLMGSLQITKIPSTEKRGWHVPNPALPFINRSQSIV